jgi:uncharacterized membrane protein
MTHLAQESLARLEALLGKVLVGGVIVSSVLLGLGLLLWLLGHDGTWGHRILGTGLITLMATPVVRVVVSAVEYTRRRDWFFALTSLAVLGVLGLTLAVAYLDRM